MSCWSPIPTALSQKHLNYMKAQWGLSSKLQVKRREISQRLMLKGTVTRGSHPHQKLRFKTINQSPIRKLVHGWHFFQGHCYWELLGNHSEKIHLPEALCESPRKAAMLPMSWREKSFSFLLVHAWQKVGESNSCKPSNDNLGVTATQEIQEGTTCLNVSIYV